MTVLAEEGGTEDLRGRTVRGGAIIFAVQLLQQVARFTLLAVLARLLSPHDYGLLGMVLAFTAFLYIFHDLGLSVATVQRASISHEQISTLFWVNVALGVGLSALLALASPLIARFYGEPELERVALWLSLGFTVSAAGIQSTALLTRRMQFGILGAGELLGLLVGGAIGIAMAWRDAGVYALVGQALAQAGVVALWSLVWARWLPGLPRRRAGVREMIRFGGYLTAFNVVNYAGYNLDKLLLGRFWGATTVGLYTRSFTLMRYPVVLASWPMSRVMMPALSKLQDQGERYAAGAIRGIRLLALVTFPVSIGLFVMAEEAVSVAYGDQWTQAIPIFRVLSLAAILRAIVDFSGTLFVARGKTREFFYVGLYSSLGLAVAVLPCIWYGAVGAAIGFTVATYVIAPLLYTYMRGLLGLPLGPLVRSLGGPALAASCMGLVVAALKYFVVPDWSLAARVSFLIAAGAAVFAVALPLFARDAVREAFATLRELRAGAPTRG